MEVSRIIFRKETKDKMEQGLYGKALGKARLEKLKELANSGKLSTAKDRLDVAHMLGYTEETASNRSVGYGWVSSMISKGYLIESINGFNKDGTLNHLYSVSSKSSTYGKPAKKRSKKNKAEDTGGYKFGQSIKIDQPVIKKVSLPVDKIDEPVILTRVGDKTSKVTVTYGDVVVGVESVELAMIPELIAGIIAKLKPSQKEE